MLNMQEVETATTRGLQLGRWRSKEVVLQRCYRLLQFDLALFAVLPRGFRGITSRFKDCGGGPLSVNQTNKCTLYRLNYLGFSCNNNVL